MVVIDLHNHTTASDGKLSPAEIIARAAECEIDYFGIADHDTVNGIEEAQEEALKYPNLTFVPCIEVSANVFDLNPNSNIHGECHIVGINIDPESEALAELMSTLIKRRDLRTPLMIEKINKYFKLEENPITEEEIRLLNDKTNGEPLGRPHLANSILARKLVDNFREVFDKYLGNDGPCYAEVPSPSPQYCIDVILKASGIPCLAHASTLDYPIPKEDEIETSELYEVINKLKSMGLAAIEVSHPMFSNEDAKIMNKIAEKLELHKSAGSDFHNDTEFVFGSNKMETDSVEWFMNK